MLRPHERVDELSLPGDDDPETGNFAAFDADEIIGTASVRREPPPWGPEIERSWRLRGMATKEDRRSEGVGSAVLALVIDHVRQHGGGLVWCAARTEAVPFYERAGFRPRGDRWVDPLIGPHLFMETVVDAAP